MVNKNEYLIKKLSSLTDDQRNIFNTIQKNKLLQICIPTGGGKNYIMFIDLLLRVIKSEGDVFALCSHRLMLNMQHLKDIFEMLNPLIGEVGFIFVGSSKIDVSKFQTPILNTTLLQKKLSFNEVVSTFTTKSDINESVSTHLSQGRKVIIVTTYHSLHTLNGLTIDTLYCDEAHTLATGADTAQFRDNFNMIQSKNTFFFTATPRDCVEETDSFLMNNSAVFGERIGLTFRECVEKGYITKPIIHIALPSNFETGADYKSVENMSKFVIETYSAHCKFVEEQSFDNTKIEAKILIKCPSVDDVWKIYAELLGKIPNVKICAGSSPSKDNPNLYNHYIDDVGIVNRGDYLEQLQNIDENQGAIVLHFDTMSEGINISGFTGVEFLGGKLPTNTKLLQNTGRATRLHHEDRRRIRTGEISTDDYSKWIKPYCAVIIPYWDTDSEFTARELARQIKDLRDNFGYDPSYKISLGCDIGDGKSEEEMDNLNKRNNKLKRASIIDDIKNEIEILDQTQSISLQNQKINRLSIDEWFEYTNETKLIKP
jgi:hypothetical protein